MSPPALPKLTINTKIGGLKDLTLNRNNSDSNSEMTLQQYRDLISSKETVSTVKGGGNEIGSYELQGRKVLSLSPSRNQYSQMLPIVIGGKRDGTIQFQSLGRDFHGFGSSQVRGGYIPPLVRKNESAQNINSDLIRVAADKVRELDLGSRGSQDSLLNMGERAERYINYRNQRQ